MTSRGIARGPPMYSPVLPGRQPTLLRTFADQARAPSGSPLLQTPSRYGPTLTSRPLSPHPVFRQLSPILPSRSLLPQPNGRNSREEPGGSTLGRPQVDTIFRPSPSVSIQPASTVPRKAVLMEHPRSASPDVVPSPQQPIDLKARFETKALYFFELVQKMQDQAYAAGAVPGRMKRYRLNTNLEDVDPRVKGSRVRSVSALEREDDHQGEVFDIWSGKSYNVKSAASADTPKSLSAVSESAPSSYSSLNAPSSSPVLPARTVSTPLGLHREEPTYGVDAVVFAPSRSPLRRSQTPLRSQPAPVAAYAFPTSPAGQYAASRGAGGDPLSQSARVVRSSIYEAAPSVSISGQQSPRAFSFHGAQGPQRLPPRLFRGGQAVSTMAVSPSGGGYPTGGVSRGPPVVEGIANAGSVIRGSPVQESRVLMPSSPMSALGGGSVLVASSAQRQQSQTRTVQVFSHSRSRTTG